MMQAMTAAAIQGFDYQRDGSLAQLGPRKLSTVHPAKDGHVTGVVLWNQLKEMGPWMKEAGAIDDEWLAKEDWEDNAPSGPWNAYTNTIAPRFLIATLLAAIDRHRRTGEGQYIDLSQMEAAIHFGEHSFELLTESFGLSTEQVADLMANQVIE